MSTPPPPRTTYGVSRIDQPEKKNHGWYVRVTLNNKTEQKFFADKSNGSKAKALKAAQAHRDYLVTLLPPLRQLAASRKRAASVKTDSAKSVVKAAPAKKAPAKKAAATKAAKK